MNDFQLSTRLYSVGGNDILNYLYLCQKTLNLYFVMFNICHQGVVVIFRDPMLVLRTVLPNNSVKSITIKLFELLKDRSIFTDCSLNNNQCHVYIWLTVCGQHQNPESASCPEYISSGKSKTFNNTSITVEQHNGRLNKVVRQITNWVFRAKG